MLEIWGIAMRELLRRYRLIVEIILGLLLIVSISCVIFVKWNSKVVRSVTLEAGTPMVSVDQFLKDKGVKGIYVTDIHSLDIRNPGRKEVQIEIDKKIYTSFLEVIDTVAPTASPADQVIVKGESVTADAFVKDIIDATEVRVSFKKEPNLSLVGEQEVVVLLEDSSGNQAEINAQLAIVDIQPVIIEAGSLVNLTTKDFVKEEAYTVSFETDLARLDFDKPSVHEIRLNINGKSIPTQILVEDTTAPTATVVNREIWKDEKPEASFFIKNIVDATEVKASYKELPDFTVVGEQTVNIILTDESGNQTEVSAKVTVKEDTEAPVISGVGDMTYYIGDSISYRKGIKVTDNKDRKVKLQIDSSSVNLKREGSYQVKYIATDQAGNVASETATITVKKFAVSDEELNKLTDGILKQITNETMTKRDVAYAIYKWVKRNTTYTGSSDKSDWKAEAYRGIKNGVGDCFTYYAISEALLTRAGIDNMRVTRVGGKTQHFWNLINCGDGWYHFDTCPNRDKRNTFMMTDAEVAEYTEYRGNNYYTFDRSLYPATPEE